MDINERDIIILSDDNSYIVAKKINYNSVNYYCVMDIVDDENIKFLWENNNELIEIEDSETMEKVLITMAQTTDISKLLEMLKKRIKENYGI